ncbi:MAG: universal stress protein [Verrucomicrobiales bacterium]|nr:universal stress protein [Verrucomicrobiales bacterium]
MNRFKKILFVHADAKASGDALRESMRLAVANGADLAALSVSKPLPGSGSLREALINYRRQEIDQVRRSLPEARDLSVSFEHVEGVPYVEIVKTVIRDNRDLVVKAAEKSLRGHRRGFSSGDLQLLRQCPCAVWMFKSTKPSSVGRRVMAAIDPRDDGSDDTLTRRVLEIGTSLANMAGTESCLHVVHCWELPFETMLRHHPFLKRSSDEMSRLSEKVEDSHRATVAAALASVEGCNAAETLIEKGDPATAIPRLARERAADVVVMGTLGRSGIPGHFIGNTAETILSEVPCSVLAIKPPGFRSALG